MKSLVVVLLFSSVCFAQSKPAYRVGYGLQIKPNSVVPTGTAGNGFIYSKSNDSNYLHYAFPSGTDLVLVTRYPVADLGLSLGLSVTNRFDVGFMRSVEIGGTSAQRPTCNSSARGRIWITQGVGGVTDSLFYCMKAAADTYAWIAGPTGG
jgi:hypothetical protein